MLIFVDESGNFAIPKAGKRNLSCVGALIIPETSHNDLIREFVKLRDSWVGLRQEAKGSELHEKQIAEVVPPLIDHGCQFFVCATEMSLNSVVMITDFQRKQAELITDNISDAHHPLVRKQLFDLRRTFEGMPTQLFLQSVLLTDLVRKVIDQSCIHFALQKPCEVGAFRWFIDGKDKTKTAYEIAWELLAAGLLQGKYIESPGIAVAEGDYTYFRRSFMNTDQKWPGHLPKPKSRTPSKPGIVWNLGKVLYESLSFVDSKNCCGLQLVDIVTNTFRRALMGRLKQPGYERLGELMPRLGPTPVRLHLFNVNGSQHGFSEYNHAVAIIESRSKFVGK